MSRETFAPAMIRQAWVCLLAGTILIGACSSPSEKRAPSLNFTALEPLSQEEMHALIEDVEEEMARGDFKRASHLLTMTEERRLSRAQSQEINRLRARLRKLSFLHHNPLDLRVTTAERICAFGEEISLYFEIFNLSENSLLIPGQGGPSWLPWGEKRKSCIQAEIELVDLCIRDGSRSSAKWSELLELEDTWEILPGSSQQKTLGLSPPVSDNISYRRIVVEAELIPGGLQTGPFDWGMIRLKFPPLILHVFREEDLQIAEDPQANFTQGLASLDGRRVLLSALLVEDEEPWPFVDGMVGLLPALSPGLRRAATAVLTWMTGEDHGSDCHRWMDWWDVNRDRLMRESRDANIPRPTGIEALGSGPSLCFLPFVAALSWIPCLVVPGYPDTEKEAAKRTCDLEKEGKAIREALIDPYYLRRNGAEKKLRSMGQEGIPIMREFIKDPSPLIRAAAGEALAGIRDEEARGIIFKMLESETDRAVKQRVVEALALAEGDVIPCDELPETVTQDEFLKNRYIDLAVQRTLEGIMHFGRIPGFYDGQFNELWIISDGIFHHLAAIARDADYAYQARVLAIMALHEKKEKDLLPVLKPLILDPKEELRMAEEEFNLLRVNERMILKHRVRNLSKYARFSLSKAGIADFNLAKIEVMKQWLLDKGRGLFLENRKNLGLGINWNPGRSFGKNIILDIAYNYQQFDQYDSAEHWYKLLIGSFPEDEDSALLAEAHYNLACLYSVQHQVDLALKHLKLSVDKGFVDFSWMDRDRDLDNIRHEPAYQALREFMVDQPAEIKTSKEDKKK